MAATKLVLQVFAEKMHTGSKMYPCTKSETVRANYSWMDIEDLSWAMKYTTDREPKENRREH